jgi:hypothetical protein
MQQADDHFEANEEALKAPPRLIAALKQLPREKVFVPATLDEAILRNARQQLLPARARELPGFRWSRFMPWLAGAAAAAVLLVLTVLPLKQISEPQVAEVRQDLNGDGVVDILDAFVLARDLDAGRMPAPSADINGDGRIDHQDVENLVEMVVRLEKGKQS